MKDLALILYDKQTVDLISCSRNKRYFSTEVTQWVSWLLKHKYFQAWTDLWSLISESLTYWWSPSRGPTHCWNQSCPVFQVAQNWWKAWFSSMLVIDTAQQRTENSKQTTISVQCRSFQLVFFHFYLPPLRCLSPSAAHPRLRRIKINDEIWLLKFCRTLFGVGLLM